MRTNIFIAAAVCALLAACGTSDGQRRGDADAGADTAGSDVNAGEDVNERDVRIPDPVDVGIDDPDADAGDDVDADDDVDAPDWDVWDEESQCDGQSLSDGVCNDECSWIDPDCVACIEEPDGFCDEPCGDRDPDCGEVCDTTSNADPSEEPRRVVTFELTNTSDAAVYIPNIGWDCDANRILGPEGNVLPRSGGFQCICECPNPGPSHISQLIVLQPGDTWSFDWNSQQLRSSTRGYDCGADGWEGCTTINEFWSVNVPNGVYTFETQVYAAISDIEAEFGVGCSAFDDSVECWSDGFGEPNFGSTFGSYCSDSTNLSVTFELGDDSMVVSADVGSSAP